MRRLIYSYESGRVWEEFSDDEFDETYYEDVTDVPEFEDLIDLPADNDD